jgi:hypothetical protein
MFNETIYNSGLSGEAAKEKRRAKYGIPEGVKAGLDYVKNVWLPQQKDAATGTQTTETAQPAQSGSFDLGLPKKIAGMPSWMLLTGGALLVLTMFKGSSRGRRR